MTKKIWAHRFWCIVGFIGILSGIRGAGNTLIVLVPLVSLLHDDPYIIEDIIRSIVANSITILMGVGLVALNISAFSSKKKLGEDKERS
jgi:hypothetical protein